MFSSLVTFLRDFREKLSSGKSTKRSHNSEIDSACDVKRLKRETIADIEVMQHSTSTAAPSNPLISDKGAGGVCMERDKQRVDSTQLDTDNKSGSRRIVGPVFRSRTLAKTMSFNKKAHPGPDVSPPNIDISTIDLSGASAHAAVAASMSAVTATGLGCSSSDEEKTRKSDKLIDGLKSNNGLMRQSLHSANWTFSNNPTTDDTNTVRRFYGTGWHSGPVQYLPQRAGSLHSTAWRAGVTSPPQTVTRHSVLNGSRGGGTAERALKDSKNRKLAVYECVRLKEKAEYAALLESFRTKSRVEFSSDVNHVISNHEQPANQTIAPPSLFDRVLHKSIGAAQARPSLLHSYTEGQQHDITTLQLFSKPAAATRIPSFSTASTKQSATSTTRLPAATTRQPTTTDAITNCSAAAADSRDESEQQQQIDESADAVGSERTRERRDTASLSTSLFISPRPPVAKQLIDEVRNSPYTSPQYLDNMRQRGDAELKRFAIKREETVVKLHRLQRDTADENLRKEVNRILHISSRLPVAVEEPEFSEIYEPRTSELEFEIEDEREEEIIEEVLPELTDRQEAMVSAALKPRPETEVLVEGFRLQLTRKDMATLAGLNWLNDEVINFYLNLLMERGKADNYPSVHAFNTFFYPKVRSDGHKGVRRWTKSVDLFSHQYILIPVHLGMHWCMAIVDFKLKQIRYYDSMGSNNDEALNTIKSYLSAESIDKQQKEFDWSGWQLINVKDIPQQMNGSDCGMFACKFADYVSRNAAISFSQADMPYFRRRMVYEILTKQLL